MKILPGGVREALARTRGERVTAAHPRAAGANSEVWEVETAGGARYFVKRYPPAAPGEADRLATEFAALGFMAGQGIRDVPEAVIALPAERVGVFGFIAGRVLEPAGIGRDEVRQAAEFLARLHELRAAAGARGLPAAKEACFSIAAHEELVRARVARLRAGSDATALHAFLDRDLGPHLERVSAWVGTAAAAAAAAGLDPRAELRAAARTLSPSDFGFHNALRRPDGTLVFFDFEYFGWDDPAKTVADFLLQPGVPVPGSLRRPFCRRMADVYGPAAELDRRLPPIYALLSLKWCLIVLNIFLRAPAGEAAAALRAERLDRARALLGRARRAFAARAFPFAGF
ncbi:MAG: aminoglycoside phosphotransferase family protein [Candidatus Methylomirabilia bacterium]